MKKIIAFTLSTLLASVAFAQSPAPIQTAQPVALAVVGRTITEPAPQAVAKKAKPTKKAVAKKGKKSAKKPVAKSGSKVKAKNAAHKIH